MTPSARATVASATAVILTSAALRPLYLDFRWVNVTIGAVLLAAAIGAVARRTPVPVLATVLLVPLLGLCYFTARYARSEAIFGVIPTAHSLADLRTLFDGAVTDIRVLAAPVPTRPGLLLVGAGGVLLCAVAVDLVAVTLHRPDVAGLVLLALYAVPSGILTKGVGIAAFIAAATGWFTLLLVEGRDRIGRWGRTLGRRDGTEPGRPDVFTPGPIAVTGRRIGAAAVSLAVVIPISLPPLHGGLLYRSGTGGDGGATSATVFPPLVTLERRLHTSTTTVLLRVVSDRPSYLRMTALDVYDRGKFTLGEIKASASAKVTNGIPAAAGPPDAPVEAIHARVQVTQGLAEPYLPLPYAPRRVSVSGDWRTSPQTLTVFSTRTNTRGLKYDVDALVPAPDAQTLRASGPVSSWAALPGFDLDRQVPALDRGVRSLIDGIVSRSRTAYDQVLAIQTFLRGPDFHYDLTLPRATLTAADPLADFLLTSRRGYCEQFATAMAVMVRSIGLPARVAIGFTAGAVQTDGSYAVTNRDAHAWPEVFFPTAGWVRFEPTPLAPGQALVPSYAGGASAPGPSASPGASQSAQPVPTATPSARPLTAAERADQDRLAKATQAPASLSTRSLVTRWALVTLLALLVLAAVGPGCTRLLLRRRRLARTEDSRAAWVELLDTAEDVRLRLPPGASPRAIAAVLSATLGPSPARDALRRLAGAEERRRYAPADAGRLGSLAFGVDALEVRRGLLAAAGRSGAARAVLAPPSELRRFSRAGAEWGANALDGVDQIINRAGAAFTWTPRRLRTWIRRGRSAV